MALLSHPIVAVWEHVRIFFWMGCGAVGPAENADEYWHTGLAEQAFRASEP